MVLVAEQLWLAWLLQFALHLCRKDIDVPAPDAGVAHSQFFRRAVGGILHDSKILRQRQYLAPFLVVRVVQQLRGNVEVRFLSGPLVPGRALGRFAVIQS